MRGVLGGGACACVGSGLHRGCTCGGNAVQSVDEINNGLIEDMHGQEGCVCVCFLLSRDTDVASDLFSMIGESLPLPLAMVGVLGSDTRLEPSSKTRLEGWWGESSSSLLAGHPRLQP